MDDAFISPKPIVVTEENPMRAKFVIEPLNPGYGMTIGNPLRRILLSSLEGHAISAIILPKVNHEFSTLEKVKEDVVEICLNIKQVHFRVVGEHEYPIRLTLRHKGEGEVKASEFEVPPGVEVVSPEVTIATLTDPHAEFEMTAMVTKGRGFYPVESREKDQNDIGTISIDAIYSPVRHVAFSIDNVRVGQMTNYNRVNLTVETDGSVTPQQAFEQAIKVFQEHVISLRLEGSEPLVADAVNIPSAGNEEGAEGESNETSGDGKDESSANTEKREGDSEEEKPKRGRKKKPA